MITTLDNIQAKRGSKVWEVGVTVKGVYRPTLSIVHGGGNDVVNPDQCWKDYDLCLAACKLLNDKAKRKARGKS